MISPYLNPAVSYAYYILGITSGFAFFYHYCSFGKKDKKSKTTSQYGPCRNRYKLDSKSDLAVACDW